MNTNTDRRYRRRIPQAERRVKARLKQAGLTFGHVAREAGVTYRMVQYVIHGKRGSRRVTAAIDRLIADRLAAAKELLAASS
jgi:transcriptional regulator with XRE-family HTH domain